MKHRAFGNDRVKISEIGLGCWQLGPDWGNMDDKTAYSILETALENGITFYDTADVYGEGNSERLIGEFFSKKNNKVFIATKVGRLGLYPDMYTEEGVRECVENSLKRLRTDTLDLIQLHCIPPQVMKEGEIFEWLRNLQKDGKIKYFGASIETMDEADMLLDTVPDLYSLQVIFNLFRQKPIHTLFEKVKEKNVGIIARVPLASGLLSGKFTKSTSFPVSDHRNYNKDGEAFNVGETFAGVPFEKGIQLADKLNKYVPPSMTMAQFALRWILDFNAVSVVIPGATKIKQVYSNAAVSNFSALSESLHKELSDIYESEIKPWIRGAY